jgi:hypothetical protein
MSLYLTSLSARVQHNEETKVNVKCSGLIFLPFLTVIFIIGSTSVYIFYRNLIRLHAGELADILGSISLRALEDF